MYKITAKIDGMMCGMCESHVCDAIRRELSVKKVTASHRKGEAVILSEEDIGGEQLQAALAPTGYRVESISIELYVTKGLFQFGK